MILNRKVKVDYIKIFKKDKKGLAGTFKILGQVGLGIIIATTLYFNVTDVTVPQITLNYPVNAYNISNTTSFDGGFIIKKRK